jgi:hypothetical protein
MGNRPDFELAQFEKEQPRTPISALPVTPDEVSATYQSPSFPLESV